MIYQTGKNCSYWLGLFRFSKKSWISSIIRYIWIFHKYLAILCCWSSSSDEEIKISIFFLLFCLTVTEVQSNRLLLINNDEKKFDYNYEQDEPSNKNKTIIINDFIQWPILTFHFLIHQILKFKTYCFPTHNGNDNNSFPIS